MDERIIPRTENPIRKAWPEKSLTITQKKKRPNVFRRWLKKKWSDEDSTLRRSTSVLVLILYSFLGSGIFFAIEGKDYTYWQCLSFANSIFTTIGWGRVYPKTHLGQVFTILYTIFGLPIMAIATSDIGLIMLYWSGKGWVKIRRFRRAIYRMFCARFSVKPKSNVAIIKADDSVYEKGKKESLPLSYAIGILILWLFLSSLYFYCTNEKWSYFIAFYFFFISVATIGLGDYTTAEDQRLTILDFVFIIGGISLFSLCVRLLVDKLDKIDDEIAQTIINEYVHSLQSSYAFDSNDGQIMEESETKQRALIQKLIKKQSGYMRFFIGKRMEAKMLREYQKRANMRLKSTQTVSSVRNVSIAVAPSVCDAQTMAGMSFIGGYHFVRNRKARITAKSKLRSKSQAKTTVKDNSL